VAQEDSDDGCFLLLAAVFRLGQVKAQARENEDIPTRTAVLNEVR
jgi:hypothetical protein